MTGLKGLDLRDLLNISLGLGTRGVPVITFEIDYNLRNIP